MKGVLLVNLGSPDSPEKKDVKKYLRQFLMDERVIDEPLWLRTLLVKGIILNTRPKKSAKAYKKIWWDEGSPLIVLSERLLKKVDEVNIKESDKVNIVLNPGQMSLHHGLTIHGSGINNSNDRRIGVAIRYLNPKIKQVHAEKDFAILARGKDKFNNFIKYDPPKELFSKKDLELHKKIREYQKMALSRNTSGIKMFQGNDNVV